MVPLRFWLSPSPQLFVCPVILISIMYLYFMEQIVINWAIYRMAGSPKKWTLLTSGKHLIGSSERSYGSRASLVCSSLSSETCMIGLCCILEDSRTSDWFEVRSGLKQGCVMPGCILIIVIDWIMRKTGGKRNGPGWNRTTVLEGLDYWCGVISHSKQADTMTSRRKCPAFTA